MNRAEGSLRAVRPFEFQRSVDFVQRFSPMTGEQTAAEGTITKALMVDGEVVIFRVMSPPGSPELSYQLFAEESIDERTNRDIAKRIAFIFSLEDEVGQFYAMAEKDGPYYSKVRELWGLHHVKFPSMLEISCWAIINQRIHRSIALRMKRALTERYGRSLELDGVKYWAFPDHERLKVAKPRELVELLRNQRTALRIGSLIDSFGGLDEGRLMEMPYQKAAERLKKVNGIGDWSAQFILFRGLGRIEKLQYNMNPVIRMMEEVYGKGRTLGDINRMYGKWCGYWSLYLWASGMAARSGD